MKKPFVLVVLLYFWAACTLAALPSRAVLLIPADAGAARLKILSERLKAVSGVEEITVNPTSLEKEAPALIVAGYGDNPLLSGLAGKHRIALGEFDLNGDGYVLKNAPEPGINALAAAHSFLGLYYALDELAKASEPACKLVIQNKIERPALRLRGITMYDNWDAGFMDSCLAWVLENRLNRIELKDTDLDDFIFYKKFDRLNRYRVKGLTKDPGWGDATLRDESVINGHREWIESYIRKCHDHGVEVVMWHHEFVVLDELCKAYPEMCAGDSLIFSSDLFFEWLESKYDEFFQGPGAEIDGIVLTTVEGNVHLVDFGEELIYRTLDMAYRKCSQYGKKLIFRTFGWDDPQETALANVANRLDPGVWVMHKHVPMDWCDAFPHNPNLVRVRGKTAMLETELAGEQRGNSRLPVWIGDYYKYRLQNALPTGIVGATGRINRRGVDIPGKTVSVRMHDKLYGGSFNPCTANLYVYSRLVWNPEADVGELYLDWAGHRYGKRAAPHVVAAFRPMRRAMQQMMLGRGQFLNLRFVMSYEQWRDVMHWGNNLSDFDHSHPVQFRLKLLEQPDDRFFGEFLPEKDEAIGMVTRALGEVHLIRGLVPEREYKALVAFFERMLNLAAFCRYQMEAFGWIGHVEGITGQARERLKICREKMLACAEALPRWDPGYSNANNVENIEMYPNMMSCIREIDEALAR